MWKQRDSILQHYCHLCFTGICAGATQILENELKVIKKLSKMSDINEKSIIQRDELILWGLFVLTLSILPSIIEAEP